MKRLLIVLMLLGLAVVAPAVTSTAQTTPPTVIGFKLHYLGVYGRGAIQNGDVVARQFRVTAQLFVVCDRSGRTGDINYVVHYHLRHDRVREPSLYNWETRPAYAIVQADCSWQSEFGDYSARIDYWGQDTHGPGHDSPSGFNMLEVHSPNTMGIGTHVWWCGEVACPPPLYPATPASD